MKKILFVLVAVIFSATTMNVAAQLNYDPICERFAAKQAKNKAKEMKKQKWNFSGSMSMEDKLKQYFLKTSDCGQYEDNSKTTTKAKTITTGEQTALSALTAEMAQGLFQTVAGATAAEISSEEAEYAESKIKSLFQGDISACIERAATFYRKNVDGTYEVQVLFLINKSRKAQLERKAKQELGDDRWKGIIKSVDNAHGK